MKVIVSGLTAAGKTTLSKRLSETLEVPYFSASGVLRDMFTDSSQEWTEELDRKRGSLSLERAVDSVMTSLLHQQPSGIFDSWGLPWYSDSRALRIWLESTPASRSRKCYVSYLQRGTPKTLDECSEIARAKDDMSRAVFQQNWGFDIFTDRKPFDMIVDCSALVPRATVEQVRIGARMTYDAVMDALVDRGLITESGIPRPRSENLPDETSAAIIAWTR